MKRLFGILLFVFISTFLFSQKDGNKSFSEDFSVQRIMLQAASEVVSVENEYNLEVVNLEIGYVEEGVVDKNGYKWSYSILVPEILYGIYAAGEEGQLEEIDLRVEWHNQKTGEWILVGEDTDGGNSGFVTASPTGAPVQYAIGIRPKKYSEGHTWGHYFILIAYERNSPAENEVPPSNEETPL